MPDGTIDGGDPPRDGGDPPRPASPPLRLATWNVNSIRTRLDRVTDWLARADVDVLAMQETKCSDSQFPTLPFFELGYEVAHVGFNQWNGVAIASRVGLDDVQVGFDGQPTWSSKPEVAATAEARALGATCGGVRVWSLYVPNGRTLDDPHYVYKLDWLAALRDTAEGWLRDDPAAPIALVGDWNIAPTDEDVWSPEFFVGSTHVSEPERKAFDAIVDDAILRCGKAFHAGPGRLHLLGLHATEIPEKTGHAYRLHPRLADVGRARDRCTDRARGTQRQGAQRPCAGAHRREAWLNRPLNRPMPNSSRWEISAVARCLRVCNVAGFRLLDIGELFRRSC